MSKFSFPIVRGSFEALLGHQWPKSAEQGWLRTPANNFSALEKTFIQHANQDYGYVFRKGNSPTLGKTIIIDPAEEVKFTIPSHYPSFVNQANRAFADAYGQVEIKHHSIEAAASGLALQAYWQGLYHDVGIKDQWSLGFNQTSYHVYRSNPDASGNNSFSPGENIFMHYVRRKMTPVGVGKPSAVDMRWYTAKPQEAASFKIIDRPETPKILTNLYDDFASSLQQCAEADPSPQGQAVLKRKLGL